MDAIRIDQYTMLQLNEYKGVFQIQEGYEAHDGSFKPSFIKREIGKRGERTEKTIPLSIKIGDKQTAIFALQTILSNLRGATPEAHEEKEQDKDMDAPF